jgi:molybdopterin-guanine dinucleotide biosynthesis protein A
MSRQRRFSEVSGFVLAGGASRRMGFDKARLPFGPERIVDRQIRLLRAVCRTVAIIAPPSRFAGTGIQVYEDEISGKGPLGGIHTGLRRARTEFSLFLGCDMPLMEERFLRYLCEQALATRAMATVPPPWAGGRYPLCAVLRRRALARVGSCLESGQNQVGRFLSRCPRRTISKAEFARAGFSARIFCNLNTPEEYERMRQQWVQ